jgi:hypothetical protein
MDQSLLAAPHGFSQRATSFIASWCQGIHRMPLSRSKAKHTHRNHPHRDGPILRHVGRLTPLSALPVLTDQRPLRSGSRQERHATQHGEVSTHPLTELGETRACARSPEHTTLFSRRCCAQSTALGSDTQPRRTQKRTNLFTLTKNKNTSGKPDQHPRKRASCQPDHPIQAFP